MAVRYKYPGGIWVILDADSFTVEQKKGQCFNKAYRVTASYTVRMCYQDRIVIDQVGTQTITGKILGIELGTIRGFASVFVNYQSANGNINQKDYWSSSRELALNNCVSSSINSQADYVSKLTSTYKITNIQTLDGSVDNCGDCVFKATKNGQVVYQETRAVCPEVEVVPDQQCPPNTCDVLCGDTICCYGADGISVFSYLNT